jgi:hypothetical protein
VVSAARAYREALPRGAPLEWERLEASLDAYDEERDGG